MKTLYLSDLDGTLLNSSQKTSEFTNKAINHLVSNGMIFSYATARSWSTASKVTSGINVSIPAIVYNGAFVVDSVNNRRIISNYFGDEVGEIIDFMISNEIYPNVYSVRDDKEKFSFIADKTTNGMADFVESRKGDSRTNPVTSASELYKGDIFYLACIDEFVRLLPLYEKYRTDFHCIFQRDIYSKEQWLEIMPQSTSKSVAALKLKRQLGCDKLVVFGDALNDKDLFECADESYAVSNAATELKEKATAVIDSNDNDGVAKWLLRRIENE
ncbi:HAD-IIB family hydrolase [Ruminococcus sp.]|uniref:HAD-IIB family hydrolase n=1 Tax=Ruminococcus sp. TaxID=41978 RepID=UPI002C714CBF|nr:HAD-IIB family hydrolase [Ruminococcus sp.]HNZ98150.1 HAD-IIB family hydrolase [Ruminococcus sp.]HOH87961.1 HAD-IIB family hydrolase [Ruminococcus sp.]